MDILSQLKEKIIHATLTKKESEIAEYILNNVSVVCFMTTSELAKKLDTSNTSVNRTAKALGYVVFANLQKELQGFVAYQAAQPDRYMLPPNQRIDLEAAQMGKGDIGARNFDLVIANITNVLYKNPEEKLDNVVKLMAGSRRCYINGYRGTADIANKLAFLMSLIVSNTVVSTREDVTSVEKLLDSGPSDCAVIITFNRYSQNAANIISLAHERGCKIILITDRATAPFSQLADELLIVDVSGISYFNSNVAALFLIELLCAKLALYCGDSAHERLAEIEPFLRMTQLT
ncbi:MAG: MurR/RpiR family transcriptional regulator [Oscillospiraceae bacterium]